MAKAAAKKQKTLPNVAVLVSKITSVLENAQENAEKFDGGNNAAGGRVRKSMQEIKVICKEVRDAVTEVKTARKEA